MNSKIRMSFVLVLAMARYVITTIILSSIAGYVYAGAPQVRAKSLEFLQSIPTAEVKVVGNHGTPTFIVGSLYNFNKPSTEVNAGLMQAAIAYLAPIFGFSQANLVPHSIEIDSRGSAHHKYDFQIHGRSVVGARIILHVNKRGLLYCINGSIPELSEVSLPVSAHITEDNAREIVTKRSLSNLAPPEGIGHLTYIFSAKDHETYLAWVFTSKTKRAGTLLSDALVFVDSETGTIVDEHERVQSAQARNVYEPNGTVTYFSDYFAGYYYPPIITYNAGTLRRHEGQGPASIYYVDKVYTDLGKVYSYYDNILGYASPESTYDLKTTVDAVYQDKWWYYPPGPQYGYNAYYLQSDEAITIGFGGLFPPEVNGIGFSHLSESLDIIGHEYTHFVTHKTSGLVYSGESGGINESLSDVFGAMIEKYAYGSVSAATWKIGEDCFIHPTLDALRFMNNPATDSSSLDYYPDYNSNVNVHYSSGIGNLAFYLLSQGGPHPAGKTPLTIPALGVSAAEQIWFQAQRYYLTPSSDYTDFRTQTVAAAADLSGTYGGGAPTNVNLAWDAVGVPYGLTGGSKPINVSARGPVGTGNNVMVGGFVLSGSGSSKDFLIRGVGPTLGSLGVPNYLADPYLTLVNIAANDNWGAAPNAASALAAQVGAFALNNYSADAAMVRNLGNGGYSLVLHGVGGTSGEALLELYDSDSANDNHIVNFSTRAQVGSGQPIIFGFVITGELSKTVLLRAVGPTLASQGLGGTLDNPRLLLNFGTTTIIENDDWGNANNAGAIASAASQVGAFALNNQSADAAILVSLPPGVYTAYATTSSGNSGLSLVELYEVP
jgi:vibriolysin